MSMWISHFVMLLKNRVKLQSPSRVKYIFSLHIYSYKGRDRSFVCEITAKSSRDPVILRSSRERYVYGINLIFNFQVEDAWERSWCLLMIVGYCVCTKDAIRTRLSSIFGAQSVAVLYYGDNEAHNKNVKKNLLCCFYCHKCWRINDAEREKWGNRFISLLLAQHFYRIRTINWSMRLAKGWRVGSRIKWEIVHTKVNFPSLLQPLRVENFVCYNNKIFILLLASSRVCKKSLLSGFVLVFEANSYKVRGDMWGLENSTTLEQHRTQSVHCLTSLRRLEIFFLVFLLLLVLLRMCSVGAEELPLSEFMLRVVGEI